MFWLAFFEEKYVALTLQDFLMHQEPPSNVGPGWCDIAPLLHKNSIVGKLKKNFLGLDFYHARYWIRSETKCWFY